MIEITEDLQRELWSFVKDRRDALVTAMREYEVAQDLLNQMKSEGLDSHLPTAEEVMASGPYELDQE